MKRNPALAHGVDHPNSYVCLSGERREKGVQREWRQAFDSHLTPSVQSKLVLNVCITFTVIFKADKAGGNSHIGFFDTKCKICFKVIKLSVVPIVSSFVPLRLPLISI